MVCACRQAVAGNSIEYLVAQGAGGDGQRDLRCAVQFKYAGAFAERRAGGHDIIDKQYTLAG